MRKEIFILPILLLSSCGANNAPKEDVISLFSDSSRLYFEKLTEEDSCPLKTYRHKYFGDVAYVELGEYFDTLIKSEFEEKNTHEIKEGKFIVTDSTKGNIVFDAERDTAVTSSDIIYFSKNRNIVNNGIPLDIYKKEKITSIVRGSNKTSYKVKGQERTYDLKKYKFDIVYEKDNYYAPFSVLNYIVFGFLNTSYIYNGKNFFDCQYLQGEYQSVQYCYSSNGNFLLDRSGGKLGAILYKRSDYLQENEAYRFVNVIEQSGQTTVVSCLKDGKGSIKSYDREGKLIDDGTYIKLTYVVNDDKSEITIKYFATLDEDDSEPISDIHTLRINLDETLFGKQTRSKEVAEFTYQELKFAMAELYGKTINTEVRDLDNFIKDKKYKDDLLSLDINKYDAAMSEFLLDGIDDAHTSIDYPSIYGEPTFAKANYYTSHSKEERKSRVFKTASDNASRRKEAGIGALDIVNKTAFIAFDKFEYYEDIKGFNEYKNTDPETMVGRNCMELFASAFNKIKENSNIKNVVVDLSGNTGGKTASMAYLLGYLSKDPSILVNLELDRSVIDYHYELDLDLDGNFATDNDSFQDKYNFYVLTSGGTFSCGNLFTTCCKNRGFAKIIGEKSGGGSCVVSLLCNSSGFLYETSSEYINVLIDGDGYKHNDGGVEVDIALDSSKFYDHTYIDSILQN